MSCSLQFYDSVTYVPMASLLSLVCGPFQFLFQFSVVVPSHFIVDIIPLPLLVLLLIISV